MSSAARKVLLYATVLAFAPSLAILLSIFWPLNGWHDRFGYIVGRDFSNFWMAGRLTAEGRLGELYDLKAYHAAYKAALAPESPFMNFSYLPNSLPLLAPLGSLPYGAALALWTGMGAAAFLWAATGRIVPRSGDERLDAGIVLASPVALLTLGLGQASFILAGLFVGGFRLVDRRPRLAGVLFGLLSLKPQFGMLVAPMLMLRGDWRVIGYAATTATGLAALSLALFGPDPWRAYLTSTLPYQARVISEPFGFAWSMMTTPYAFFAQLGAAPAAAMMMHKATVLVFLSAALLAARHRADASSDALLVAVATLLISPYGLAYDIAIPAAALIWSLADKHNAPSPLAQSLSALFWALPVVMMALNTIGAPVLPPVLMALFAALVWRRLHAPDDHAFSGSRAAFDRP